MQGGIARIAEAMKLASRDDDRLACLCRMVLVGHPDFGFARHYGQHFLHSVQVIGCAQARGTKLLKNAQL